MLLVVNTVSTRVQLHGKHMLLHGERSASIMATFPSTASISGQNIPFSAAVVFLVFLAYCTGLVNLSGKGVSSHLSVLAQTHFCNFLIIAR